jgi:hypothetical protein
MRPLAILAAAAVMVASPAIASAAPPCPPEVKEAKSQAAARGQEVQAPRGRDVQAPRGQDVAERALANAHAAMALLKYVP